MCSIPINEGMVATQTFVLVSYINKLIEQGHLLVIDGKLIVSEEVKLDKRFASFVK